MVRTASSGGGACSGVTWIRADSGIQMAEMPRAHRARRRHAWSLRERSSERLEPALYAHRSCVSRTEVINCRPICNGQEDVQTSRIEPVFEHVDASRPQVDAIIVQSALSLDQLRRDRRRARLNWRWGYGSWLGWYWRLGERERLTIPPANEPHCQRLNGPIRKGVCARQSADVDPLDNDAATASGRKREHDQVAGHHGPALQR